jgi:hypothetical protein
MKYFRLVLLLAFVAGIVVIGCSDDDEPTESGVDVSAACDVGLCRTSEPLKNECMDLVNACLANEPDSNDDECIAAGIIKCGL